MEALSQNAGLILTGLGILGAWFKGTQYIVRSELKEFSASIIETIKQNGNGDH